MVLSNPFPATWNKSGLTSFKPICLKSIIFLCYFDMCHLEPIKVISGFIQVVHALILNPSNFILMAGQRLKFIGLESCDYFNNFFQSELRRLYWPIMPSQEKSGFPSWYFEKPAEPRITRMPLRRLVYFKTSWWFPLYPRNLSPLSRNWKRRRDGGWVGKKKLSERSMIRQENK